MSAFIPEEDLPNVIAVSREFLSICQDQQIYPLYAIFALCCAAASIASTQKQYLPPEYQKFDSEQLVGGLLAAAFDNYERNEAGDLQ